MQNATVACIKFKTVVTGAGKNRRSATTPYASTCPNPLNETVTKGNTAILAHHDKEIAEGVDQLERRRGRAQKAPVG